MKRLINLIKSHPCYFFGYSISAIMYWLNQGPKAEELADFAMNLVAALIVGIGSWAYIAAKIINLVVGG